jgi:hypothetical protein
MQLHGLIHQPFQIFALGDVSFDDGVVARCGFSGESLESIETTSAKHEFRSERGEMASSRFTETAAGTRDDDYLALDIVRHGKFLLRLSGRRRARSCARCESNDWPGRPVGFTSTSGSRSPCTLKCDGRSRFRRMLPHSNRVRAARGFLGGARPFGHPESLHPPVLARVAVQVHLAPQRRCIVTSSGSAMPRSAPARISAITSALFVASQRPAQRIASANASKPSWPLEGIFTECLPSINCKARTCPARPRLCQRTARS